MPLSILRLTLVLAVLVAVSCQKFFVENRDDSENNARTIVEEFDEMGDEESVGFVKQCRKDLSIKTVPVDVPSRSLTDGPYRWATIPYRLEPNEKTVQLFASLTLDLTSIDPADRPVYWERLQGIRQCVREFYMRHEIFLQLELLDAGNPKAVRPGDPAYVNFRKSGFRVTSFNMSNWAFEMDGVPLSNEVACTVFSHEFGHMLGLRDEYPDSSVEHRTLGADDSVMRSCHLSPDEAKLYPRHLRTILKRGCETAPKPALIRSNVQPASGVIPF